MIYNVTVLTSRLHRAVRWLFTALAAAAPACMSPCPCMRGEAVAPEDLDEVWADFYRPLRHAS